MHWLYVTYSIIFRLARVHTQVTYILFLGVGNKPLEISIFLKYNGVSVFQEDSLINIQFFIRLEGANFEAFYFLLFFYYWCSPLSILDTAVVPT